MTLRPEYMVACLMAIACLGCDASATLTAPAASKAEPVKVALKAPENVPAAQAPSSQPAASGERIFGAPLSAEGEPVEVSAILRDPAPFLGKNVKTKGVVARVCERAGCWLELKPEHGEGGLRVPMAGHAFFIPQDALGRPAIVEGELTAQALSPSHKEHLEGEGAQAVGPLSLAARGVVVR